MIIDCLSDLHGNSPALEGGDVLIIAGDLTRTDTLGQHFTFGDWLRRQDYKKKIVIAGNHDLILQELGIIPSDELYDCATYLCDSVTEFEWFETEDTKWGPKHLPENRHLKLKIWGSPWTKTFKGMNPKCKAFTVDTEEELADKWALIPDSIDILITHSPPYGILDRNINGEHCGSESLAQKIGMSKTPPKLWVCGHIHESYGRDPIIRGKDCIMVNASHVNEHYQPVNKPLRVIL